MAKSPWFFFLLFAVFTSESALSSSAQGQMAVPFSSLPASTQRLLKKWVVPLDKDLKEKVMSDSSLSIEELEPWTYPATSIFSPVAFGANWGNIFAAFVALNRQRFQNNVDLLADVGFGIGNSSKWVGIQVGYSMVDLHDIFPWRSGGSLSFKVHRSLPDSTAIAVGIDSLVNWDGVDRVNMTVPSPYVVASKIFIRSFNERDPFSSISLHVGMGTGYYQPQVNLDSGKTYLTPFASVGIRLLRPISLIVNWYGSDLGVGASLAPFRQFHLMINPSILDITGYCGDSPRFMLSVAWWDNFQSW